MVRTDETLGKKRPFWRGLLLTAVTFGVYGVYWKYQALQEVHEQFELADEGRDDGVVWLVMGIVVPVLMLVYYWKAVGNVAYVRRRLGVDEGIGPVAFVGLHVASRLILIVGLLSAVVAGVANEAPFVLVAALAAVAVVSYSVLAYAYYRLQTEINEVWDAFEDRRQELTGPGPAERGPGPGDRGPGFGDPWERSGPTG